MQNLKRKRFRDVKLCVKRVHRDLMFVNPNRFQQVDKREGPLSQKDLYSTFVPPGTNSSRPARKLGGGLIEVRLFLGQLFSNWPLSPVDLNSETFKNTCSRQESGPTVPFTDIRNEDKYVLCAICINKIVEIRSVAISITGATHGPLMRRQALNAFSPLEMTLIETADAVPNFTASGVPTRAHPKAFLVAAPYAYVLHALRGDQATPGYTDFIGSGPSFRGQPGPAEEVAVTQAATQLEEQMRELLRAIEENNVQQSPQTIPYIHQVRPPAPGQPGWTPSPGAILADGSILESYRITNQIGGALCRVETTSILPMPAVRAADVSDRIRNEMRTVRQEHMARDSDQYIWAAGHHPVPLTQGSNVIGPGIVGGIDPAIIS